MNLKVLILFLLASQTTVLALNLSTSLVTNLVTTVFNKITDKKLTFSEVFKLVQNLLPTPVAKLLIEASGPLTDILYPVPELPTLDHNLWWGEDGQESNQDTTIRPYTTKFNENRISLLKEKLASREPMTSPLINANFTYGTNSDFLDEYLDTWSKYDFVAREKYLNQYPQYMTNIQGLDIHYYHIKPNTTKKTLPLLMIHGWPSTNIEFFPTLPYLLADNEYKFAFELIIPSMPGYGYSQRTNKQGLNTFQIAIFLKNLMTRIGHNKFYVHADDLGIGVADDISTIYSQDILGYHTNLAFTFMPKALVKVVLGALKPKAVDDKAPERLYPITNTIYFLLRYFGYFHMHSSKPDTIGTASEDSPVALASWIVSACSLFNNPSNDNLFDGNIPQVYGDNLLDWLTVYWDTNTIKSSQRLYAEYFSWVANPTQWQIIQNPSTSPFAAVKYLHEVLYMPDKPLKDKHTGFYDSTVVKYGGHFASVETPKELAKHIFSSVKKFINYNRQKN